MGLTLSVAVALLAVEVAMRLLGLPFYTGWTPPEYARAQFDPEIGWVYIPNWSGVQQLKVAGEPRSIPMYFDEIGARVRAPGTRHDPGIPTVLFVGCSFTAGFGVSYEETFVGQLESQTDFPFQVVNLGVEAFGTDQALLLLKRYFKHFDTKVVVYTFIADHVPRNHNYDRRMLFRGARFVGTKPLFGLDAHGVLTLRKPPLRYEDLSASRLGETIELAWARWGPKPTLDLTNALVREMKDYVESNGATFIVVAWDWDWTYLAPRDQWPPFRDLGVHLVDAAAKAPADWQRWRIPGDSHPNPRAHARIAQLLKDELQGDALLPSPAAPAAQP